jgi:hypothetical protein
MRQKRLIFCVFFFGGNDSGQECKHLLVTYQLGTGVELINLLTSHLETVARVILICKQH